jgi:fermentation-respiration switch protein FrsA (DUF1100 family)
MRIALFLLIAGVLWAIAACALQRRMLFPRHVMAPPAQPSAAERRADIEQWHHASPAGPVEAWYLPAPGASDQHPRPAVIFAHGNAELIDDNLGLAEMYNALGMNVLLPEYRGYGRSAGDPNQQAIVSDFTAFYDRLVARPEVDGQRVVFIGRSIGGGVVAQLAKKRRPAAMILESTFTSVAAMASKFLVPRLLVRDPFDVRAVLKDYPGPVLLFHGTADEIVPVQHGRKLHEAAPNSTLVTYPVGHNDGMPPGPYEREVAGFLARHDLIDRGAATQP